MKNLHLLPTEKPSRLYKFANELHLDTIPKDYYKKYNIYITNDEKPKSEDWCLSKLNEVVRFGKKFTSSLYKKIILTTDQDLIADGVQAIDDEFLEWFVNNPSCESVVVNFNYKKFRWSELNKSQCYKIIIPQEESKQEPLSFPPFDKEKADVITKEGQKVIRELRSNIQQETLEEAAEKEFPLIDTEWCRTGDCEEENLHLLGHRKSFIKGANWQSKRMYSEEDMIDFAHFYFTEEFNSSMQTSKSTKDIFNEWFEQFKKK
jgi:hypothetical protein